MTRRRRRPLAVAWDEKLDRIRPADAPSIPLVHVRSIALPPRLIFGEHTRAFLARAFTARCGASQVGPVGALRWTANPHAGTCPECIAAIRRDERRAGGAFALLFPRFLVLPEARP